MRKPVESPIDRRLGLEICSQAKNIGAILAGSLNKLGSAYRLQVELVNPVSGDVLATNQQEAQSSEGMIPVLRSIAYWVRESLGEQMGDDQPKGEGREELTLSRLRALSLYTRAVVSGRPPAGLPGPRSIMTASSIGAMIASVRTTVTIDPDVEQLLRDAMQRTRKSFKATLNQAIRKGLGRELRPTLEGPFKVKALAMGLRAGVDPAHLNQLDDEIEVDAFLERTGRLLRAADADK